MHFLIKYLKNEKKVENLTISRLDHFWLRREIENLTTNVKFYSMYYY